MLRLSTFSCILLYVFFMYNSSLVCVFIPSFGCYRCLPSGSQVSQMVLVATLVTWLQPHGSSTCPQDNQFPLEALSQARLPIIWPNARPSLSFYGIPCHVASPSWKLDLTLNWWFPNSIDLIRCRTLFYYVSLCKLGYGKKF